MLALLQMLRRTWLLITAGITTKNGKAEFSERNVALQGCDSLRMQARILRKYSEKSPVIIVERDIPVQIQVTERIPLDILLEAGVVGK